MQFQPLPRSAAWQHLEAREGFESVFASVANGGVVLTGHTAAVEEGVAWAVHYVIELDVAWRTRGAVVTGWSERGRRETTIELGADGRWRVDGVERPDLDDCPDIDLESSACTNTLPVHREALAVGDSAPALAVYVRADDLRVERLEQRYTRLPDGPDGLRYDYESPAFETYCVLSYDRSGLVVDYPGIARRAF